MHRLKTTLIFVFALFLLSFSAHAQGIPGVSDPLIVTVIPQAPRPNESVSISIKSFNVDLDKALIVWTVNGKEAAKGVGIKDLDLIAGPTGSAKHVDVSATLIGLGTFNASVDIIPAEVGLVWQSDTYVPPFYKGKALHSFGGSFKVVALPEFITAAGKKLASNDLIYTWRKNGDVDATQSGYGKDTFTGSQTSYLRQGEEISVEVSAPANNIVASNSVTVVPTIPQALFYEKSPLYGVLYEKALGGSFKLTNEEITVITEPYFFSVGTKTSGNLSYAWTLNGASVPDFAGKPFVTLRRTGAAGVSALGLTVQNSVRLLQGANQSLNIRYE